MKIIYKILIVFLLASINLGCTQAQVSQILRGINDIGRELKASAANIRSGTTNGTFLENRNTQTGYTKSTNNSGWGWSGGPYNFYGRQPCKSYGIRATIVPWRNTLTKIHTTALVANRQACIKNYGSGARARSKAYAYKRMSTNLGYNSNSSKDTMAKENGYMPGIWRNYPPRGHKWHNLVLQNARQFPSSGTSYTGMN